MADNTKQFHWIVFFKENLECLFAQNEQVFVAEELLWYPTVYAKINEIIIQFYVL